METKKEYLRKLKQLKKEIKYNSKMFYKWANGMIHLSHCDVVRYVELSKDLRKDREAISWEFYKKFIRKQRRKHG